MSNTVLRAVDEATPPVETWEADNIPFPFGVIGIKSNGEEIMGQVNLADFIGSSSRRAKETLLIERRKEWNNCDDPTSRKQLTLQIIMACAHGGFNIKNRGWEPQRSRISFICQRGVVYSGKQSKVSPSKQRRTTTQKPTCADELCRFRFQINWCREEHRWIMKGGYGYRLHGHHPRKEFNDLKLSTKLLSLYEKQQAACGCDKAHIKAHSNGTSDAVHAVTDAPAETCPIDTDEEWSINSSMNNSENDEMIETSAHPENESDFNDSTVIESDTDDSMRARWKQGTLYSDMLPLLQDMVKLGEESFEAYKVIVQGMRDLHNRVLQITVAASEKRLSQTATQIVPSPLEVEQSRKAKRKCSDANGERIFEA